MQRNFAAVSGAEVRVDHSDDLAVSQQAVLFDESLQLGEDVPAACDLGIRAEEVEFIASNHDLDPNRLANFAEVSVTFSKQGADEVLILEIDRCFGHAWIYHGPSISSRHPRALRDSRSRMVRTKAARWTFLAVRSANSARLANRQQRELITQTKV